MPFAFIWMFPYLSYAVGHEDWKTFIVVFNVPVYFFLLQMTHSLNFSRLYFGNILHAQMRDLKNQKINVTLLYLLENWNYKNLELHFYKRN